MPNALNDQLTNDPETFLKTWSICPPDHVDSYKGKKLGETQVGITAATPGSRLAASTRSENVTLARVERTRKVGYINLKQVPRGDSKTTGNEGGDRISFESAYVDGGGWVPVYWLPWNTVGAAIRLTIPRRNDAAPGPDLFFTAAINGCSVFFQGARTNPTIYHCGGDTGQGADSAAGATFWREVVAEFTAFDARRGKDKGTLAALDVNKTHYVKTPGFGNSLSGAPLRPGEGTTTPQALAYRRWLENEHDPLLRIEEVNPWACVMGIRKGDDWTFYIQENATVIYHQVRKKKGSMIRDSETRYIARPMLVYEVFPGGRCIHRVHAPIPRIV